MDTHHDGQAGEHPSDSLFEQHVRAGCDLAQDLAARLPTEGLRRLSRRIRRAWVEAELPSRCPDAWATIWRAAAADPDALMSRRERRAHSALPARVTAYRGFSRDGARGWSWTLQRDVAEDFAVRYEDDDVSAQPRLCTVQVESRAVIAVLLLGDEQELIIDPDTIERSEATVEDLR